MNRLKDQIRENTKTAFLELLDQAKLKKGDIVVVGCSSSEIVGQKIGTCSNLEAAEITFDSLLSLTQERGLFLAAQCCEHLNRGIVLARAAANQYGLSEVNVVPFPYAGGAFATIAYQKLTDPVVVEHVQAAAGMDIGGTLIGMHLKEVAVPVRTSIKKIGEASILLARTRPKFIGGERAHYNKQIL